ncbi:MAG: rRNA maturation RNase YbeY [Verrucomicrobiae bacterium]|nr:rRNA maturation RNase YbeY [Verrucomicrobiae bacterium]
MIRIRLLQKAKSPRLGLVKVRALVRRILALQAIPHAELGIVFVNDSQMMALHGEFMADPTPTDIMTFPLGPELAELVISLEMGARQAREFGNTLDAELALYIIHGVLHLAGYDDHKPRDIRAMRAREAELLQALGKIPRLRG